MYHTLVQAIAWYLKMVSPMWTSRAKDSIISFTKFQYFFQLTKYGLVESDILFKNYLPYGR